MEAFYDPNGRGLTEDAVMFVAAGRVGKLSIATGRIKITTLLSQEEFEKVWETFPQLQKFKDRADVTTDISGLTFQ
jgi:hypothetical protein